MKKKTMKSKQVGSLQRKDFLCLFGQSFIRNEKKKRCMKFRVESNDQYWQRQPDMHFMLVIITDLISDQRLHSKVFYFLQPNSLVCCDIFVPVLYFSIFFQLLFLLLYITKLIFSTQNENQNSPLKIPFNHPTYTYTHACIYTHTIITYFTLFIS